MRRVSKKVKAENSFMALSVTMYRTALFIVFSMNLAHISYSMCNEHSFSTLKLF